MERSLKILIVDDDKIGIDTLKSISVNGLPCSIDTVTSSTEALNRIYLLALEWQPKWYDLILVKLDLPTLDGQLLATIIRDTEPNLVNIPIIATSSGNLSENRGNLPTGLTAYITKPKTEDDLVAAINNYLIV